MGIEPSTAYGLPQTLRALLKRLWLGDQALKQRVKRGQPGKPGQQTKRISIAVNRHKAALDKALRRSSNH